MSPQISNEISENLTISPSVEGNTNFNFRAYHMVLTYHGYTETDYVRLLKYCDKKKYAIGVELTQNGGRHLQGYISHKNQMDASVIVKMFPGISLRKAKADEGVNLAYCAKEKHGWITNIPVIDAKLEEPKVLKLKVTTEMLKPWQKAIIKLVESEPDDRSIWWIWSAAGCNGKTTTVRYLLKQGFPLQLMGGSAEHIKYALAEHYRSNDIDSLKAVFWDLPRARHTVDYTALEEIKDGQFFSSRYKSGMCMYNYFHVIVFANKPPDESQLSVDRMKVFNLDLQADINSLVTECDNLEPSHVHEK